MKSADPALNRALVTAIRSALDADGREDVDIAQALPESPNQDDLIVLMNAEEAGDKNTKLTYHSSNTQTVRCFSEYKIRAKQLAALVIEAATASKLDLTPFGFRLKETLDVALNRELNQTTESGVDFSQVLRFQGRVQPIS